MSFQSAVHAISAPSTNISADLPMFPALRQLSASIFETQLDDGTRFTSEAEWRLRLDEQDGVILFVSNEDDQPSAYLFAHSKTFQPPLLVGSTAVAVTTHLWLSGVRPDVRKRGLMSKLFDELLHRCPNTVLSVRTHAIRYPAMVGWLRMTGWEQVGENGEGVLTFVRTPGQPLALAELVVALTGFITAAQGL